MDKKIEETVYEILPSHPEFTLDGYWDEEAREKLFSQLKALILKTCEEVIGEDESESCSDKECEVKHYHLREQRGNQLRAEQRQTLKKLI